MSRKLVKAESTLATFESTLNQGLTVDQWAHLLKLRRVVASMMCDHDPKSADSALVLNILQRASKIERRFTALATHTEAKSMEAIAHKAAHWIMDKGLQYARVQPEDASDALVLSTFRDLVALTPHEDLQSLLN